MAIEEGLKAFKTKLKVDKENYPKQFNYLMKTAKACAWVKNWYVREILDRMKKDGVTVFTEKKELKQYSPRELRKDLTVLINSDPKFAWLKGIPSTPRFMLFEHLIKTYSGGENVKYNFEFQCECAAKDVDKNIKNLKGEAAKKGEEPTEEEIEKAKVFFGRGGKAYKMDDMYGVRGFPRFKPSIRHLSFSIDGVVLNYKERSVTLPASAGNKKMGIPKLDGVKIFFYDHDFNPEGIDKEAMFTFSYDGESWWMSVKQVAVTATCNKPREEVIGIDLGIKTTAYLSNGKKIINLTEDKKYKKLEERKQDLDRLRHKNLHKSPMEYIETPYGKKVKLKSAKYDKLTKHIQRLDNKILNYKDTLFKQCAAKVVHEGVKGIVLEDFEVEPLKKNKKWSGKVQRIGIGKLREFIVQRAKAYKIPVMMAPRMYPSTQICSNCGKQNEHMRKNLGERTFVCEFCGHTIDRDLNASRNLANLWGSPELIPWKDRNKKRKKKKK